MIRQHLGTLAALVEGAFCRTMEGKLTICAPHNLSGRELSVVAENKLVTIVSDIDVGHQNLIIACCDVFFGAAFSAAFTVNQLSARIQIQPAISYYFFCTILVALCFVEGVQSAEAIQRPVQLVLFEKRQS
jgi:hypothetical protein